MGIFLFILTVVIIFLLINQLKMNTTLQAILDKTTSIQAGVEAAQATAATIATDIEALKTTVANLSIPQADIDTVNAALDGLGSKVSELNTSLTTEEGAAH